MAQLFETLCMMLAFKESHSLAMHYCRLVWDVRSLSEVLSGQEAKHKGETAGQQVFQGYGERMLLQQGAYGNDDKEMDEVNRVGIG